MAEGFNASDVAIDVKGVHKSFQNGKYHVYKGIDIQIQKGKVTYILGPSGVGKSVLLKHTLGLLKPDQGSITVFGNAIPYDKPNELNNMRKNFGMLFQSSALFDDFTVYQNVAFPLIEHRRDIAMNEVRKKVEETLVSVGLKPDQTMDKLPSELSGGMKKRVGLARAIIIEPKILLYDEPTTGLDPVTRSMVDDLIEETNKKFKLTSVVISHDLLSAVNYADRICFLFGGKIVFCGSPEEFMDCDHEEVQNFLNAEKKHQKGIQLK